MPLIRHSLPNCPACGKRPKFLVRQMSAENPEWWYARIECPLPCEAQRTAGAYTKGDTVVNASLQWRDFAKNYRYHP